MLRRHFVVLCIKQIWTLGTCSSLLKRIPRALYILVASGTSVSNLAQWAIRCNLQISKNPRLKAVKKFLTLPCRNVHSYWQTDFWTGYFYNYFTKRYDSAWPNFDISVTFQIFTVYFYVIQYICWWYILSQYEENS